MIKQNIELLRVYGLFSVIVIHVNALGVFSTSPGAGFLIDELSRFAVPAFFIVSGYLWKDDAPDNARSISLERLKRLAPPFLLWGGIYFVLDRAGLFYPFAWRAKLVDYLLFPITGGPGFHLWFLPALVIGTALCLNGIRILGLRYTLAAAVVLYVIGVFIGNVLIHAGLHFPSAFWRNGFLESPLFLMLGYTLRIRAYSPPLIASTGVALLGAVIHVSEGYWRGGFPFGHDYSLGTVLFASGIVAATLRLELKSAGIQGHFLGRYVLGGYITHLLFLSIIVRYLPAKGIEVGLAVSFAVLFLSMGLSALLKMVPFSRWLVGEPAIWRVRVDP